METNELIDRLARMEESLKRLETALAGNTGGDGRALNFRRDDEPRNLTLEEVARRFRKAPGTIRHWVAKGLLRPIPNCRPLQFSLAEIERRENAMRPWKLDL